MARLEVTVHTRHVECPPPIRKPPQIICNHHLVQFQRCGEFLDVSGGGLGLPVKDRSNSNLIALQEFSEFFKAQSLGLFLFKEDIGYRWEVLIGLLSSF